MPDRSGSAALFAQHVPLVRPWLGEEEVLAASAASPTTRPRGSIAYRIVDPISILLFEMRPTGIELPGKEPSISAGSTLSRKSDPEQPKQGNALVNSAVSCFLREIGL